MTDRTQQLAGALSADITRMVKERYPDELAHAQAVHARSEKLVLGFMVSSVALWFLGPALLLNGLISPAIAIVVPGLLTLGVPDDRARRHRPKQGCFATHRRVRQAAGS